MISLLFRNPAKQQFSPKAEAAFRANRFQQSLRPLRLLIGIGTVLYGLFIPFDYLLLPFKAFAEVTAIRLVTCLLLLGVFSFAYSRHFARWWQPTVEGHAATRCAPA